MRIVTGTTIVSTVAQASRLCLSQAGGLCHWTRRPLGRMLLHSACDGLPVARVATCGARGPRASLFVAAFLAALSSFAAERPAEPREARKPPEIRELKPGLLSVDLTGFFNSDGITDPSDRTDSNFDLWRQSFDAAELPDAGVFAPKEAAAVFVFPSKEPRRRNNIACEGQAIPLRGSAKQLHLLITATDYEQEEQLVIQYADGEKTLDFKVSDWCQDPQFGEKRVVVCPHRISVDSEGKNILSKGELRISIWAMAVPVDPARELKGIVLPKCPCIHIFALTLAR